MEYRIGKSVRLITDDSWDGLTGVIDDLIGDFLAVFCVTKPSYRYFVAIEDADRILELI